MREEVVPHVVFDVPGRADQDAAHQESEHPANEPDGQKRRTIGKQLGARHSASQVVDRELQDLRRGQCDALCDDRAGKTGRKCSAISRDIHEKPAKGTHLLVSIILRSCTPCTSSFRRCSFYGLLIGITARSLPRKSGCSTIRGRLRHTRSTTAQTITPPPATFSSDIISQPSQGRDRSSVRYSRLSSDSCPACSGSSSACVWPARSRIRS